MSSGRVSTFVLELFALSIFLCKCLSSLYISHRASSPYHENSLDQSIHVHLYSVCYHHVKLFPFKNSLKDYNLASNLSFNMSTC